MPLPIAPKPWSFYRLGPTKEKELFKRHRDTYDGVVIPAHIASYYSTFCAEFVGSLRKPYFIDPMTYIFSNDPSHLKRFVKVKGTGRTERDGVGRKKKGDIKRSYSKLIDDVYQGIVKAAVANDRSLVPADFTDASMSQFVQNVLDFQRTRLVAIPDKYKKYEKYVQKADKPMSISGNLPMCLVAPYFPTATLHSRGWHSTNLQLVRQAKAMAGGLPIFAMILASPHVLDKDVRQIAADYIATEVDGFLLWPDGFSSDQDPAALRVVFNAVDELSRNGKPVILMYGDAFSLVLHYAGLSGFACGICYGEHKLSTLDMDVEGAIPPRYYVRRLKKKYVIDPEAMRISIEQYPDLVCNCAICQRKPDPATLDDTDSREHFMLVRSAEINELRDGLSQAEFAAALDEAYQLHCNDPLLQPITRLRNWVSLLSS
ncbi:hypothetical protein CEE37_04675 [candidate division LCP-89 bacterium B3_LCP]|uniref:tRNA-guanine(15) transglycosylase-like domain-containing protein n=1 Tax=candidate division LCP-89 bacterium B3_LCP TaxID=2012998 RepID=A0A532V4E0_UNCL8|nr:MAG: hypothetical protein CEE37_04675 [candidate division LCP-89 bacterium B3_LCP]